MLDAIKAAWARDRAQARELRFETFGSSGRFAPKPFRVRIPRLGLETTVPHDVVDARGARGRGADMMYDCRRGECGLCQVKVLDVQGAIDHRDVFLSDDQHQQATGCSAACRASSARAPAACPTPTAKRGS